MKKLVLASLIIAGSISNVYADIRPYIGASVHAFTISSDELTAVRDSTGEVLTQSGGSTNDNGITAGISGGILVTDNIKIDLSYFSGKEDDSSILKATVSSLSVNYTFTNAGAHRGFFLGAGVSNVSIDADAIPVSAAAGTDASSASATGALIRGGYEYLFDNQLFLEVGVNAHLAEVKQSLKGTGLVSGVSFNTDMSVTNINLTLSYVF